MRIFGLFLAAAGVACSPGPSAPYGDAGICAPARGAAIAVSDIWVRPASTGQSTSAAYFTICNATGSADSLIGVQSPAAASVELHRTSRDADGIVSMAPVEQIDLPPGVAVALMPGATHVMLIGLVGAIEENDEVELSLMFEKAPPLSVKAKAKRPDADDHGGH